MIIRRSLIALALLLAAFATPAFSQSANLANPAALREQAPADLQGQVRHQQGRVRDRGARATGRRTAPTASTIWSRTASTTTSASSA